MKSFFKEFFTFDLKKTFRVLVENEKDQLNTEIISLKRRLEEAYIRRDYLNNKLGYV